MHKAKTSDSRLKILISAYACGPYSGSEPGVGWGFVEALAKRHDVWVITEQKEFQQDISHHIEEHGELGNKTIFNFIPRDRTNFLEKLWPPAYYWTYRRWHQDAFVLAMRLHREIGFDLAHQLNMVGFREPGYLWKLGIPFVWGPIGGMGVLPWRFLPMLGGYGALYYLGYNLLNVIQMHFLRRPKMAAEAADSGLIVMNQENQDGVRRYFSMASNILVPVGPPSRISERARSRLADEPLRIIWSGLHIPRKALNLALWALSLLPEHIEWELHVLGGGGLTMKWQRYADRLGLGDKCVFYGQVTREEVLQVMENSHLHLFTSLREGTPTVIVEACSFALPTVCLDISGMKDMVDDTFGLKVKVTTPSRVAKDLAVCIMQLAENEALRFKLAKGALLRVQEFSWGRKAEVVDRIYKERIRQADLNLHKVRV